MRGRGWRDYNLPTMAERNRPDDQEEDLEFDPLDPRAATRVAPRALEADLSQLPEAPPPVDRHAATKVVMQPTARLVVAKPLKIDFTEVLGKSREVAGAQKIGAHALEMGDFQSKYDKEALERAQAAPKFDMPSSIEDEARFQPVRVVEKRGRVWLRALIFVIVPTVLAVGAAFVYYNVKTSGKSEEFERLKKSDEAFRKAASEHEKEMAR